MDDRHLLDTARDQLNRTLGFFPRVDSKASVLLAVNTGMLAILVGNAPPIRGLQWYMLVAIVPVFLIGASYWHLYKEGFPSLTGGHDSLIYFREIAKRTESKFVQEFKKQTEEEYVGDMLSQVWRNSEILKEKFDHVRHAFHFMAWAILPWLVSLAMFVSKNTELKSLIAR